jgi:dihydroflavonol-4-reductase
VATTETLLRAAENLPTLKKFTLLSSLTVVGPSPNGLPLDESAPYNPITSYGESKVAAEKLVQQYADKIPTLILRPPAVYGPRDRDILEMFRWINRGIIPLLGKEERTLSLIHGLDLARGILEASFAEQTTGKTYFISEDSIHRFVELLDTISQIMVKKTVRVRFPAWLVWTLATLSELAALPGPKAAVLNREKVRDLLQPHWVCSPAKLKQDIGFETRIPTLDGLRSTYRWYQENGWL